MRVRGVIGGLLCIAGVVWIGQGVGLIKGSFMTGEIQWALIGGATLVVGLALLSLSRRARRDARDVP
ncbi:MAG: hypothetical protein ABSH30_13090 [Acidimicrobiales bacterium]|jgi:hypothetical protein